MDNRQNIQSVLRLEKMFFDKIEFKRLGDSSDKELEMEIKSSIAQRKEEDVFKIILSLTGNKQGEYVFEISLTGFFSIGQNEGITEELKKDLITKNAIAILMPYLRSEVSLLTAQPGLECVVLPAFNINNMLKSER